MLSICHRWGRAVLNSSAAFLPAATRKSPPWARADVPPPAPERACGTCSGLLDLNMPCEGRVPCPLHCVEQLAALLRRAFIDLLGRQLHSNALTDKRIEERATHVNKYASTQCTRSSCPFSPKPAWHLRPPTPPSSTIASLLQVAASAHTCPCRCRCWTPRRLVGFRACRWS